MTSLLAALERWDELGHVGQVVESTYCDCDDCKAQTELRLELEKALYERDEAVI